MELQLNYDGQVVFGTICKFEKALYGLKSLRAWFGRFIKVMTGLNHK